MPTRARMPDVAREYFRQEGGRGGTIAAKNMTPAARVGRAKKAAAARWKDRKKSTAP